MAIKYKGGKWCKLYHKGILCEGWFRNPKYVSDQECIMNEEDYTTLKEIRLRKLKKLR